MFEASPSPAEDIAPPPPNTGDMFTREQVISYVRANAHRYDIDGGAALAVATFEGLNTAPGSHWTVPGERYISFGPPSWYGGGAGAALLQRFGNDAPRWSWTQDGIDYWLNAIANSGARGLRGAAAIRAIVVGFERPREDLVQGEINNALSVYVP